MQTSSKSHFELVLDDKWVLEQVKKRFGGYLIKSKSYKDIIIILL